MLESIWMSDTKKTAVCRLESDLKTGVCIIGAGLTGVLTGYLLKIHGIDAILVEANRIGSGQTGRTTAKITSQHGLRYSRLLRNFGEAGVWQYGQANEKAITSYERLIQMKNIDCDFMRCSSYLYTEVAEDKLIHEQKAAEIAGIQGRITRETELPLENITALEFPNQATFHPLKFLYALAKDLEIYEQTPVLKVRGTSVETPGGHIEAKHIVFACHFPFVNIPGYYFSKMYQERSYVLGVDQVPGIEGMYYGIDPQGLSFRWTGEYMLLGGMSHRTGSHGEEPRYDRLEAASKVFWPKSRIRYHWSAQDCRTLDGVPYIGTFSSRPENWYVATGYDKWGMTTAMIAAEILTNLIRKRADLNRDIFTPRRELSPTATLSMLKNSGHILKDFSRYILPDKKRKACPHMGCPLTWNAEEQTYEYPCHGSRFDQDGQLLDGPSQTNLSR